jgi:hypothetical protein
LTLALVENKFSFQAVLPDGIFHTQNATLGKFGKVLQSNMLVNVMDILSILTPFGLFYGHLVYFVAILVYFYSLGK